jgi:hypothetical protein
MGPRRYNASSVGKEEGPMEFYYKDVEKDVLILSADGGLNAAMLEIADLDKVFGIYPGLDEALKAFGLER